MKRRHRGAIGGMSMTATLALTAGIASADPFYTGADISLVPFLQSRGDVYSDASGQVQSPIQVLEDAGANTFRIRLFVNPSTNYDDPSNRGAIQTQAYDISLAQQIKQIDPTANIILALHYSDTWTNPGQQPTPAAWSSLTYSQLKSEVQNYTVQTIDAFRSAGVAPDMVQVGNEITAGMLWPQGEVNYTGTTAQLDASWAQFGGLLNSAIAGVRQAQLPGQHIPVIITEAPGDVWYSASQGGEPRYFYDSLTNLAGVTGYDIMGVDDYPTTTTELTDLKNNLDDLATRYDKPIMLMETSYPYESLSGYSPSTEPFPTTPQGQQEYLQYISQMMQTLPNNAGEGFLWWYPESIPTANTYIWQGGALGLFDSTGQALPAMSAFNVPEPSGALLAGFFAFGAVVGARQRHPKNKAIQVLLASAAPVS